MELSPEEVDSRLTGEFEPESEDDDDIVASHEKLPLPGWMYEGKLPQLSERFDVVVSWLFGVFVVMVGFSGLVALACGKFSGAEIAGMAIITLACVTTHYTVEEYERRKAQKETS